jgi:hypothetical protein
VLVGHQEVVAALSQQLPPVSIITGPPSVGKKLIATYSAMMNNVPRVDFTEVTTLTVSEAQRVKTFMETKPYHKFKFALIDLDRASKPAIDDLLKALEEPPAYARFSIISSKRVPRTLATRGFKYNVGLLNSDDLYKILVAKNISPTQARKLSTFGRVDLALQAYYNISLHSAAVNILSAVEQNDYELFCQCYKAVDDDVANLVVRILQESAVGKIRSVDPVSLGAFAKQNVALKLLATWSTFSQAKPKLAMRVTLESVMKG